MSGLSKLGTALITIFVISLLFCVIQLLYVLWRKRVFRQQISGDNPQPDPHVSPSKELLYFLCLKTQSRVEPALGAGLRRPEDPSEVIDMFKLREMYGSSRVLFTIKEEEREDLEGSKTTSEDVEVKADRDKPEEAVVVVEEEFDADTTPFSTPCASPVYFTPVASPARESGGGVHSS